MFKFRLTDGRMAARLQSILEGDDAQAAQATAAPRGVQVPPDRRADGGAITVHPRRRRSADRSAHRRRAEQPPYSSSPPPRGTIWPGRGTAAREAASRYLVFKFRLTDERMVAQLPSILEDGEAQATAAEQPRPAREELAG